MSIASPSPSPTLSLYLCFSWACMDKAIRCFRIVRLSFAYFFYSSLVLSSEYTLQWKLLREYSFYFTAIAIFIVCVSHVVNVYLQPYVLVKGNLESVYFVVRLEVNQKTFGIVTNGIVIRIYWSLFWQS